MVVLTSNVYFLKINFLNNQLVIRVPMVFSYWTLDVSQTASYESLKGVEKAVCSMENKDLTKESVKIIGISFSYNKAI